MRNYGPGKFDLKVDEIVYMASLDGCADVVSNEGLGWWGLVDGPVMPSPDAPARAKAEFQRMVAEIGLDPLEDDEVSYLSSAAFVVSEDEQGFFSVEAYSSREEAEARWAEVCSWMLPPDEDGSED